MTYAFNIDVSGNGAENDTDAIDRMLAVFTANDETMALNNENDDSIAAESGMVTGRDSDALFALVEDFSSECVYSLEPVDNYDGELNDRYVSVCTIHNH